MEISIASKSDAPEILAVQKAAFETEAISHGTRDIQPLTETLDELLQEYSAGPVLKATENGKIVGSARADVRGGVVTVEKVVVLPEYRRRGIAKALVSKIEEECPASRYEIFTSTRSPQNIALYESLGYAVYGEKYVNDFLTFALLAKEA